MFRIFFGLVLLTLAATACGGRAARDDADTGWHDDGGLVDAGADRTAAPLPDVVSADDVTPAPDASLDRVPVTDAVLDVVSDRPAMGDAAQDRALPSDVRVIDAADDDVSPAAGDSSGVPDGVLGPPDGCGPCGLAALTITPRRVIVSRRGTAQFRALGTYIDGSIRDVTTLVVWKSTSNALPISGAPGTEGLVTSVDPRGWSTATISALLGTIADSATAETALQKRIAVGITPVALSLARGTSIALRAMLTYDDGEIELLQQAVWQSSNPSVASVSSEGVVAGVATGTSTIAVTYFEVSTSIVLTVTSATLIGLTVGPTTISLPVGIERQLMAMGHLSDGSFQDLTSQATWRSSDDARVTVQDVAFGKGKIKSVAPGVATVSATVGALSATANIDVMNVSLQSITVSLSSPHLLLATPVPVVAIGQYSDGSAMDITNEVTWEPVLGVAVATGGDALVWGTEEATTSIRASLGNVRGSLLIAVRAAALTAIELAPQNPMVAERSSVTMEARGRYSDGSVVDLTRFAAWTTSAPEVAVVTNALESTGGTVFAPPGVVTGVARGNSNIGVIYGGMRASTTLTVTP